MKLINAGTSLDYASFIYNCNRNRQCQKEFFVPIRQLSDLMFYFDLPWKPDDVQIVVHDLCNDELYEGVIGDYVIGQKPDESWYGVINGLTFSLPEGVELKKFFIYVISTSGEESNIHYSQHIEIEQCDPLMYVQGCYPNVTSGDAEDCNGIYYGFHQGPDDHIGTLNFRYFHWAYVRLGSIKNIKRTLNFTAFNSKRTYKTEVNKDKFFESEIVPDFYAEHLFAIYERGDIRVDGVQYRLKEQQDFNTIDTDSNWWVVDCLLTEFCKQTFGCEQSDCTLPEEECCDPTEVEATTNPCDCLVTLQSESGLLNQIIVGVSEDGKEIVDINDLEGDGFSQQVCVEGEPVFLCLKLTEPGSLTILVNGEEYEITEDYIFLVIDIKEIELCGGIVMIEQFEDPEDSILYFMERQEEGTQFDLELSGTAGSTGRIYWGDGSPVENFNLGGGFLVISHIYSEATNRICRIVFNNPAQFSSFGDTNGFVSDRNDGYDIIFGANYTNGIGISLTKGRFTTIPTLPSSFKIIVFNEQHLFVGTYDGSTLPAITEDLQIRQTNIASLTNLPSSIKQLHVETNPLLTNIGTLYAALQQIVFQSSAVTSVDISALTNCSIFGGYYNSLTSSEVDEILIALAANAINNGTCQLAFQTPSAPPSAPGVAAVATLTGRGWSVSTD